MAGSLTAKLDAQGRWPALSTRGEASASGVKAGALQLRSGRAQWQAGTALDAPVEATVELGELAVGPARIQAAVLRAQGSGRAHRVELTARSNARPPAWAEALQPISADKPGAQARVVAQGGFVAGAASAVAGWRGTLLQLDARPGEGEAAG
ncbi:hypothetical protein FSC37_01745 [Piscinibacter aquaticus]|uniref:DUF3971 domain-containing protein n=1 Tax=Piscinibacter aquaticus TaxID=392597 RepID=A0A5C6TXQ4_9BURK|nr:hypothetical protein FSC37_01745 [Piscinibacter aquaticus]